MKKNILLALTFVLINLGLIAQAGLIIQNSTNQSNSEPEKYLTGGTGSEGVLNFQFNDNSTVNVPYQDKEGAGSSEFIEEKTFAQITEIGNPFYRADHSTAVEYENETVLFYSGYYSQQVSDLGNSSLIRQTIGKNLEVGSAVDISADIQAVDGLAYMPSVISLGGDNILMITVRRGLPSTSNGLDSDIYYNFSSDRGITWTPRQTLVEDDWYYPPAADRLTRLESGRLIYATPKSSNNGTSSNTLRTEIVIFYSDDDGQTWTQNDTGIEGPNGKTFEIGVFQNDYTGRLTSYFRTLSNFVYFSDSDDNGQTWTPAYKSNLIAENAQSTIESHNGILYAVTSQGQHDDGTSHNITSYYRQKLTISTSTYNESQSKFNDFVAVGSIYSPRMDNSERVFEPTISFRNDKMFIYYSAYGSSGYIDMYVKKYDTNSMFVKSSDIRRNQRYTEGMIIGYDNSNVDVPDETIKFPKLTANRLMYLNSSKELKEVTLGSGLNLTNGILSAATSSNSLPRMRRIEKLETKVQDTQNTSKNKRYIKKIKKLKDKT